MSDFNRREFLKYTGLSSLGFIVSIQTPLAAKKAIVGGQAFEHHYFAIGEKANEFVFIMDKAEMGQGVITGQATIFCEEIDLNPERINILPAPVDPIYGTMGDMQLTGGSTSTPDRWQVLRQAGADIRAALLKAAAKEFGTTSDNLVTSDGVVSTKDGSKSLTYNKLATLIKREDVKGGKLKSPKDFKYIGKGVKKADALEKTMGEAQFGIDFHKEGMLTAVILRPPTFGGKVKSFDKSKAMEIKGIKDVIEVSRGVAVIGEKYWQVNKARALVKVDWELGKNKDLSSESIQKQYKDLLESDSGKKAHAAGDVEKIFEEFKKDKSGVLVEAQYELPYLAHATMEPMNAAADVKEDRVDIWVGSQGPTSVQNEAADRLGLNRDQVFVHNMKYLGGGFGRRSTVDYPMEALELSQKLKEPVRVMWSREDDMQFSPMRPINRHHLKAVVKEGKPVGYEHRIGCESLIQAFIPGTMPHMLPGWLPKGIRKGVASVAGGALDLMNFHMVTGEGATLDYDVENQFVGIQELDLDIPIHFWRAVGHSYNGFVKESFIDELAHAAKADPYAFRQKLLAKNARGLTVLNKAAKMANWGKEMPKDVYQGIAYHFSFGSYVAQVAEVKIKDGTIKVQKVFCSVDCGVAINPDIIVDQMKSGIIYGLSAALHGKMDLKNGGFVQTNFHEYNVMTLDGAPDIEVEIIDSEVSPMGVGEPGLPPAGAAVANAIFAGSGKRMRTMPFTLS